MKRLVAIAVGVTTCAALASIALRQPIEDAVPRLPREPLPASAATTPGDVKPPPPPSAEMLDPYGSAEGMEEDMRLLVTVQSRRGVDVPLDDLRQAMQQAPWTASTHPAPHLPLTPEERQDGRAFVKFNRLKLESLRIGDRYAVAIPQLGREYSLVIEEIQEHEPGITSWNGRLEGMPPHFTSAITQGPEYTYGGIATPEGHFTLEVHGTNGWIVSTDTISVYDPSQPHVLIPPEDSSTGN